MQKSPLLPMRSFIEENRMPSNIPIAAEGQEGNRVPLHQPASVLEFTN